MSINVTGLSPLVQHEQLLRHLDGLAPAYRQVCPAGLPDEALHVIAGRRRIIVAHFPVPMGGWTACNANGEVWPCPDYLNAACNLVEGLGQHTGRRRMALA